MSYDMREERDGQDGWELARLEHEAWAMLKALDADSRRVLERLEKPEVPVETRQMLPVSF